MEFCTLLLLTLLKSWVLFRCFVFSLDFCNKSFSPVKRHLTFHVRPFKYLYHIAFFNDIFVRWMLVNVKQGLKPALIPPRDSNSEVKLQFSNCVGRCLETWLLKVTTSTLQFKSLSTFSSVPSSWVLLPLYSLSIGLSL